MKIHLWGGDDNPTNLTYNVVLIDAGPNKINVVKVVREITGLGLAEAKNLVNNTPCIIKEAISLDEVNEIISKIEAVGGSCTYEEEQDMGLGLFD